MIQWPKVGERFTEIVSLWMVWTISWTVVTYWALRGHFGVSSPPSAAPQPEPSFITYWYWSLLTATNIGANDVVPVDDTGRIWIAVYSVVSIGALYAIIASY